MRKPILAMAMFAMLPLGACASDNYGHGYGYDRPGNYNGGPRHHRQTNSPRRDAETQMGTEDNTSHPPAPYRFYCPLDRASN